MISILVDTLSSQARLLEWFDSTGMSSEQIRRLLGRAGRIAAVLGGSPAERAKIVRGLVEKVILNDSTLIIKVRYDGLLGGGVRSSASDSASDTSIDLKAAVAFRQRGAENQAGAARSSAAEPPIEMRSGVDQGNRARSRVV